MIIDRNSRPANFPEYQTSDPILQELDGILDDPVLLTWFGMTWHSTTDAKAIFSSVFPVYAVVDWHWGSSPVVKGA